MQRSEPDSIGSPGAVIGSVLYRGLAVLDVAPRVDALGAAQPEFRPTPDLEHADPVAVLRVLACID